MGKGAAGLFRAGAVVSFSADVLLCAVTWPRMLLNPQKSPGSLQLVETLGTVGPGRLSLKSQPWPWHLSTLLTAPVLGRLELSSRLRRSRSRGSSVTAGQQQKPLSPPCCGLRWVSSCPSPFGLLAEGWLLLSCLARGSTEPAPLPRLWSAQVR